MGIWLRAVNLNCMIAVVGVVRANRLVSERGESSPPAIHILFRHFNRLPRCARRMRIWQAGQGGRGSTPFFAHAAFAVPARCFPDPLRYFPVRSRKFPVPLRREFAAKILKTLRELSRKTQNSVRIAKFPCIFPVNREFRTETGSQQTARTTTQSEGLASLSGRR